MDLLRAVGQVSAESGFSLIQGMVAVGIVGILMAVGSSYTSNVINQRQIIEARGSMDALVDRLSKAISRKENIELSAASGEENEALRDCLFRDQIDCVETNANPTGMHRTFSLWVREEGRVRRLIGNEARPAYYSRDLRLCDEQSDEACRFWQVTGYFWAQCPAIEGVSQTICDQAQVIQARFQVLPYSQMAVASRMPAWPDPEKFDQNKKEYAFATQIIPVQQLAIDECPPNSRKVGEDTHLGRARCECLRGFVAIGINEFNQPSCGPSGELEGCPTGERPIGVNADGSIRCVVVEPPVCRYEIFTEEAYECVKTVNNVKYTGWIEEIEPGICTAPEGGGKKGGGTFQVRCTTNRVKCCWYW